MSSIRFYHYESEDKPKKYNFPNGSSWHYGFNFLFNELAIDKGLVELKPETATVLRDSKKSNPHYRDLVRTQLMVDRNQATGAYNSLQQRDDVERWQKIAMSFLADYTLVLDTEREEVANALRMTLSYLKGNQQTQRFDPEIINLPMDAMLRLNSGPIIVTSSNEDTDNFKYLK